MIDPDERMPLPIDNRPMWKRPRFWLAWKLACLSQRVMNTLHYEDVTVTDADGNVLVDMTFCGDSFGCSWITSKGMTSNDEGSWDMSRDLGNGLTLTVSDMYRPRWWDDEEAAKIVDEEDR